VIVTVTDCTRETSLSVRTPCGPILI